MPLVIFPRLPAINSIGGSGEQQHQSEVVKTAYSNCELKLLFMPLFLGQPSQ